MRDPLSCNFWPTNFFFLLLSHWFDLLHWLFFFSFLLHWVRSSSLFFFFFFSLGSSCRVLRKKKKAASWQAWGPKMVWKIVSDGTKQPWYLEWWLMSDEWWMMKIEWWVMSDEWWKLSDQKKWTKQALKYAKNLEND